jgi:hypothetical protein
MSTFQVQMRVVALAILGVACMEERSARSPDQVPDTVHAVAATPLATSDTLAATADFRCGLPRHLQCADRVYLAFFDSVAASMVPGYRLPTPSDFRDYWSAYASFIYKTRDDTDSTKAPYWTKGDFNNDGATDFAYILIRATDAAMVLHARALEAEGARSCEELRFCAPTSSVLVSIVAAPGWSGAPAYYKRGPLGGCSR